MVKNNKLKILFFIMSFFVILSCTEVKDNSCGITKHEEKNVCVSNSKIVDCKDNKIPDNATKIDSKVEITWSNGNWSGVKDCDFICNDNFHKNGDSCVQNILQCEATEHEEFGVCKANTKMVSCTDNTPENAIKIDTQVEIIWNDGNWSEAINCDWNCNNNFVKRVNTCVNPNNVKIELRGTIYRFEDFFTNLEKDYKGTYEVSIDEEKVYIISTDILIGSAQIQPKQYFGFDTLDENHTHITGSGGTYQYILSGRRLEEGNHRILGVIGEDIQLREETKFIRPVILANYRAETPVSTNWTNIQIEELELDTISDNLLENNLSDLLLKVKKVNDSDMISEGSIIEGEYGNLFIREDGDYSYRLDPHKVSLKNSHHLTEKFNIKVIDNLNRVNNEELIINIFNKGSKPVIVLNGIEELRLQKGFRYYESGAIAVDYEDGDMNNLVIESDIDINNIGNYFVTYNVVDSDGNLAKEVKRIIHVESSEKDYNRELEEDYNMAISASDLLITTSASLLSKHRRNLSLESNKNIDSISNYSYMLISNAIYWNSSRDGSFLWQPGVRKNNKDFKYAGKIDGKYQTIPTDTRCSVSHVGEDFYENSITCNLKLAVVDNIGMDTSHYLGKWPIFYQAMKNSSNIDSPEFNYYNQISSKDSIQVENIVDNFIDIDGDGEEHITTNFMNGTNGPYRWNYSGRGKNWGYNSYGFPYIYGFSSIGYSNSDFINNLQQNILNNINKYSSINKETKEELLLLLSVKFNDINSALDCLDINQYENCKEKYIFNHKIKPELELTFTGENADIHASYYKIVGQHNLIMNYAFKHNILEWKKEYYRYFSNFVKEVIDTDAKHFYNNNGNNIVWKNLNPYSESHFMLWASMFLELSSRYDTDYLQYLEFNQNTEEKLRSFIEKYVINRYETYKKSLNSKIR